MNEDLQALLSVTKSSFLRLTQAQNVQTKAMDNVTATNASLATAKECLIKVMQEAEPWIAQLNQATMEHAAVQGVWFSPDQQMIASNRVESARGSSEVATA